MLHIPWAPSISTILHSEITETYIACCNQNNNPNFSSIDNGSCFISMELKDYLSLYDMKHIRTRPYHPMTQGKIERYHRSMQNLLLLDNFYSPTQLQARISEWVDHYNNNRYHEAIDNVTPSDKYFGREREILKNRRKIKKQTIRERRKINKMIMLESLSNGIN